MRSVEYDRFERGAANSNTSTAVLKRQLEDPSAHIIPGVGGLTVAVIAIITGYMARNQIKQSGEQGIWMANAGIIIGIVHISLLVLLVFIVLIAIFVLGIALFGFAAHSSN